MEWLIALVVGVLRVLLPELLKSRPPTAEDAARQPELRRKLRNKVRGTWGRRATGILLALALVAAVGCQQIRTVYIPYGEPVRLRATVPNAEVWVKDADGKTVPGRLDLLEGWYCLSLDDEEAEGETQ